MPAQPSFFARLWLAIVCWFRIVFDAQFAGRVLALQQTDGAPQPALPTPPAGQALQLLAMLQREGRLVDFCEEDLTAFPDAQVGAAARAVHEGCRKALRGAFTFAAVRIEPEGATVSVSAGFDPRSIRLVGNLTGSPPFSGTLRHHGWRVTGARMPAVSGDPSLIAPAEVELA